MTLAETLRQRCLLSVSLCNVGRDFSSFQHSRPMRVATVKKEVHIMYVLNYAHQGLKVILLVAH